MPGGLMQLVGVGAQNQLTTGNPTFTHFKALYRKHTNFAMEHFSLNFKGTDLNLPATNQKTLRCKIDRNSDLLHDIYLMVNLPDIYSPLYYTGEPEDTPGGNARAYEFQWVKNIGYNMIEKADVLINGSTVVSYTGEWLKFYSYLYHDRNKRYIIDKMVGNEPELYDPANANGRTNNYPNAIQPALQQGQPNPSIPGRQLVVPLHFWFCEHVGKALPLVALQYAEVEIVITFRNIYQLFTVLGVDPNDALTVGQRIIGTPGSELYGIQNFLSPPNVDGTPTVPTLTNWALNPYIEANYVFLADTERAQFAANDHGYLIPEVRWNSTAGQVGPAPAQVPMFNLCTRIVFAYQRSDRQLLNDWDNYTNWENPEEPPLVILLDVGAETNLYSSGLAQPGSNFAQNILQSGFLELDGKERFKEKPTNFFALLQHYRHHTGSIDQLPGLYAYSFALDHNTTQPSGSLNGSMFNKSFMRNNLVRPSDSASGGPCVVPAEVTKTEECVYKDTVFNPNPTVVINPAVANPNSVLAIYRNVPSPYPYTFNGRFYVESMNYLRIMSGIANVAFST